MVAPRSSLAPAGQRNHHQHRESRRRRDKTWQ
jgi:hypothetical protein